MELKNVDRIFAEFVISDKKIEQTDRSTSSKKLNYFFKKQLQEDNKIESCLIYLYCELACGHQLFFKKICRNNMLVSMGVGKPGRRSSRACRTQARASETGSDLFNPENRKHPHAQAMLSLGNIAGDLSTSNLLPPTFLCA